MVQRIKTKHAIAIIPSVIGAMLALAAASVIINLETEIPGSALFPMPSLLLFEWATFGITGATYMSLSIIRSDANDLRGAWAVIGAYLPLIALGPFSIAPITLLSALLLLVSAILVTTRKRIGILGALASSVIGAVANLIVLLVLIMIGDLVG